MVVRKLTARVQRWQLLTRYYANKWHYDGSKWAERFWYGERKNPAASIASVPFMITRNMRAQLEQAGFPAQEIASLVPQVAHQLLTDKVNYAQYVELKQKELAELAARAVESIKREEEEAKRQQAQKKHAQPQGLVIVEEPAKDDGGQYASTESAPATSQNATSQLAIVIQEDEKKEQ